MSNQITEFMNIQTTVPRLLLSVFLFTASIVAIAWYGMFYAPTNNEPQRLLIALASLIVTIFVLTHQYLTPKHPKFMLHPRRKLMVRIHITCGTAEIVCAVIAYFTGQSSFGILTALFALGHAATALYQMPTVFGAQIIMVPGYGLFIGMHIISAVFLLQNSSSHYWLLNTFIVLQTYAWVRVLLLIFQRSGLFAKSQYTAAILVAGMMTMPAVLGDAVNLFIIAYAAVGVIVYRFVLQPQDGFKRGVLEHDYVSLIDSDALALWKEHSLKDGRHSESQDVTDAKAAFAFLDKDDNGCLELEEVQDVLLDWRAPKDFVQAFLKEVAHKDKIDFAVFYEHLWHLGKLHERIRVMAEPVIITPAKTDEEKARFIFEHLDLNGNGYLDAFELHLLIDEWGLPVSELDDYLKLYADTEKRISFENFFGKMKSVWHFGYDEVLRQHHS
jgi:Ca2+-binding EF-hand superfamily protein